MVLVDARRPLGGTQPTHITLSPTLQTYELDWYICVYGEPSFLTIYRLLKIFLFA